jgi:hypothetical protein
MALVIRRKGLQKNGTEIGIGISKLKDGKQNDAGFYRSGIPMSFNVVSK